MSAVAVIVIVLVALLTAMLIAAGRRYVAARAEARSAGVDFDVEPYRSHAEASRGREHKHEAV